MSQESEVEGLRAEVKRLQGVVSENYEAALIVIRHKNDDRRRLQEACRSTNRGITRLSKRCQSQAKKIAELKLLLEDAAAVLRLKDSAPALRESIDIALHGRRPTEKAT